MPYETTIYQRGDGDKTLDTALRDITVQPRYLQVEVEMKNLSEEDWPYAYLDPCLYLMEKSADGYVLNTEEIQLPAAGWNIVYPEPLHVREDDLSTEHDLGTLAVNETRTVTLGYLITGVGYDEVFMDLSENVDAEKWIQVSQ